MRLCPILQYCCPLKSHGRDNKLHVWKLSSQKLSTFGGSALAPGSLILELAYSLDVNALNFCRFSSLCLDDDDDAQQPSADTRRALVAVPNLVESSLASPSSPFFSLSVEKQHSRLRMMLSTFALG